MKNKNRTEKVMEFITLNQLAEKFGKGRFATVTFVKKSDGNIRTLNGKTLVYSALKGGEASYDASAVNQLRVCDVNVYKNGVRKMEYRSVVVNNVLQVASNGVIYKITSEPTEKNFITKVSSLGNGVLYLGMNGKSGYKYFDVPTSVIKGFYLTANRGKYYNDNIKGKYTYSRVS